jgi:cytoskeletal protein CcmA (bactofilin family)
MKFGSGSQDSKSRSGEITGFFAEGVEIQGDLIFKDTLRVDGKIQGTIRGDGELVIGPSGAVEGEVTVTAASVSGKIKGILRVKDRLEVHSGGKVEGDVLLGKPGLVVHDGGTIEAKLQMGTSKDAPIMASGSFDGATE